MKILHPIHETPYNDRVNSVAGQLGDMTNKRVAGGRVQLILITFQDFAKTVVRYESGFDKQSKTKWQGQEWALRRIFTEYGWPLFEQAILIAVIRKWMVDPADGFIPLGPGSIDIEAGLNIQLDLHKECMVKGQPGKPDQKLLKAITKKVGLATEYGNGDSIEFVVPFLVAGTPQKVKDTEFGRKAGVILVTPTLELYFEELDINRAFPIPDKLISVKVVEAMKIAKELCRECDIK